MVKTMYRFVIKKTYIDLILSMQYGENKIIDCAKKIGINYAHLTMVFNEWVKEGIITKKRKENSFDVSLTEKGKRICKCLENLKKAIDSIPGEEKDTTTEQGDDTNGTA